MAEANEIGALDWSQFDPAIAQVKQGTNTLSLLEAKPGPLAQAVDAATAGSYQFVEYLLPPNRLRTEWPPSPLAHAQPGLRVDPGHLLTFLRQSALA